jgi:phosphate transport system protein
MTSVEKQLDFIRVKVASMGQMASKMFKRAIEAMLKPDETQARAVIEDDTLVDSLENEIEGLCLQFLALQAPKALELRYAVAVTRLTTDIERIADHATVLCREFLNRRLWPILVAQPDFGPMVNLASSMVEKAINSFLALDDQVYHSLYQDDREIGKYQRELNSELVSKMASNTDWALEFVSVINIIRRVERVADHAKNIAVMVPYVTKGVLLRHNPEDKVNADNDD